MISNLTQQLSSAAKDIKLNLIQVMQEEGSSGLSKNEIGGIALAASYATKNTRVINEIITEVSAYLSVAEIHAAKSSAVIMAMNNIYYRFIHLVNDQSFAAMPAKLRMNVIGNSGIDSISYEMFCLAVSAINGCGMCIEAHTRALLKNGVSQLAIQSSVRIAAVIHAVALDIETTSH